MLLDAEFLCFKQPLSASCPPQTCTPEQALEERTIAFERAQPGVPSSSSGVMVGDVAVR